MPKSYLIMCLNYIMHLYIYYSFKDRFIWKAELEMGEREFFHPLTHFPKWLHWPVQRFHLGLTRYRAWALGPFSYVFPFASAGSWTGSTASRTPITGDVGVIDNSTACFTTVCILFITFFTITLSLLTYKL